MSILRLWGDTKGGPFDIPEEQALAMLRAPNPHRRPNSDVIVPWVNGLDVTRRPRQMFIIDFPPGTSESNASKYEAPFRHVVMIVKAQRDISRTTVGIYWQHERAREEMRVALKRLPRFFATVAVSKHRLFVWMTAPTLPDHAVFAFARDDDYFFGVLHSRFHEVWALKLGTRLETRPRYTPTSCFETFPFPEPTHEQKVDISTAVKELNELRENWLNPPEWTATRMLEFPGATDGPWSRFVVDPDARGIGTVRYPRVEARDDDCARKLVKRTLTNLYNERPAWLANAHARLDAAVAQAYGFPVDLAEEQILERLLALNRQRAADEKSATRKQPRVSRAKTDEEFV
jgi:type II restriction/modification system DNA methylase subunit YeeA